MSCADGWDYGEPDGECPDCDTCGAAPCDDSC